MNQENIPKRFRQRIQAANEQQLEELDLSNGGLTEIPDEVLELTQLTFLNLSHNQLTSLPESIGNLSNLTTLDLRANPLETPPLEVASKGIEAIREYFRQLKRFR